MAVDVTTKIPTMSKSHAIFQVQRGTFSYLSGLRVCGYLMLHDGFGHFATLALEELDCFLAGPSFCHQFFYPANSMFLLHCLCLFLLHFFCSFLGSFFDSSSYLNLPDIQAADDNAQGWKFKLSITPTAFFHLVIRNIPCEDSFQDGFYCLIGGALSFFPGFWTFARGISPLTDSFRNYVLKNIFNFGFLTAV